MAWNVTSEFKGYFNKRDKSNLIPGVLVAGSKNVVSTDGDLIATRKGYTLLGAANTVLTPIEGNYEWDTSSGTQRALRSYDDELEVLIGTTWERVLDSWSAVDFKFAVYWDTTEEQDALLFVNGDSNIYYWSGGYTTYASMTKTAIGTTTINAAGSGYAINDVLDLAGGTGGQIRIDTIGGSGEISTYTIINTGTGYSVANGLVLSSPITLGVGGKLNITALQNTITKQGVSSWAEERFLNDGTTLVRILDSGGTWREFTYTGGETTTTLTGVTPDPTAYTFTVGARVMQKVRTTSNKPASSSTTFPNDSIEVLNNQVYVGSLKSSTVYMSKVNDYTSYTPSSPRLVGEGTSFNLDAPFVGFQVQEDSVYISACKSQWYQITFQISADNTAEEVQVKRLKSGSGQGAISQDAIGTIKNSIVFISNEPSVDTLGRIESVDNPQSVALSDPIKTDFDYYTLTGANLKYYKNNLYVAIPSNSTIRVYNLAKGFWEPPWTLPAGRLAIIDDELCIHSSEIPETYKLLQGYNDNGNAIEAIARFSYQNFGSRSLKKRFTEWFNEGYISSNTTLYRKLYYDFRGIEAVKTKIILGTNNKVLALPGPGGIGKTGLGKEKFAGSSDSDDLRKFRIIHEEAPLDFYEITCEYNSNDIDQNWAILAFGPDIENANYNNNEIKE